MTDPRHPQNALWLPLHSLGAPLFSSLLRDSPLPQPQPQRTSEKPPQAWLPWRALALSRLWDGLDKVSCLCVHGTHVYRLPVWPHLHRDCPLLHGPVPWTPWQGGKWLSNCSLLLETHLFGISWLLLVPGHSPMVLGFSSWVPISVGGTTTRLATQTPILNVPSLLSSLLSPSASLFCLQRQSPVTPGPECRYTPILTTSCGCPVSPQQGSPLR